MLSRLNAPWRTKELELLNSDKTDEEIAQITHRSVSAVKVQRSRHRSKRLKKRWTDEELDILRSGEYKPRELSLLLDRSMESVYCKMKVMRKGDDGGD